MSASTPRSRRIAPISTFLGLLILLIGVVAPGAVAKTITVESLTLCVKTSGPEKGVVRFAGKSLKCQPGEQRIQVAGSGKQGVLGVSAESGTSGAAGAKGDPGAKGEKGRFR
jgi:hypothetical protein